MKLLLLMSGGIDSPVAGAIAQKAGHELCAVHFHNYPFTDEKNREKAFKNLQRLADSSGKKIRLYTVRHGPALTEIAKKCDRKMNCVLCRRLMFRISQGIAEKEGCRALLTGESLAQVASQTLWNLAAERTATGMLVVRPLLGMDKTEIIEMARKFGTFETSTETSLCCTIVPKKPSTMSRLEAAEREEARIPVHEITQRAVRGAEISEIEPKK